MPGHRAPRVNAPRPLVIFTHDFFPVKAGISVFVQELARAAADIGHDVRLYAPGHARWRSTTFPYAVHALPRGRRFPFSTAAQLLRLRRALSGSILYLPDPKVLEVCMYLQLSGGLRPHALIVTLHGTEIHEFHASPWRRRLFARLLERANRVTVLSDYCRRILVERFPIARGITVVTPPAVRTRLRPEAANPRHAREAIEILTVARIHPRKGHMALLSAIDRVAPDLKARIRYRMVGPIVRPRYLQRLLSFAGQHGIDVECAGEVDDADLPGLYRAADIFAMTSVPDNHRVEGFGLSYLEASAFGLPIIAHRTGGVEDAVEHEVTGLLVEPGDVDALANALTRLIGDPELRDALGRAGRERAGRCTWAAVARQTFG
jgi:phosphatidylinositol alpha-1,6-mannosyltransferase